MISATGSVAVMETRHFDPKPQWLEDTGTEWPANRPLSERYKALLDWRWYDAGLPLNSPGERPEPLPFPPNRVPITRQPITWVKLR